MAINRRDILLSVALFVLTVAVFASVYFNQFIAYDDLAYVTNNPHVLTGLSIDNLRWAFTTGEVANWHPLTWISLQLDAQIYGHNPSGYHLTNVALHALNAVLLYWIFRRMTGAVWESVLLAAIFAVHPLRVESVAWASERKDVLSTFFGFIAILAYLRFVERPKAFFYVLLSVSYALSLMSKPMLVTMPFLLLLLDFWPLKRTGIKRLVLEKIPLLAMAIGSCVVTFLVQRAGGAVVQGDAYSIPHRVGNAALSIGRYSLKTVWPTNLAVFYPDSVDLPVAGVVVAALFVAGLSILALSQRRRRPYLLFGWLWFLGTLVPVIGIVQVGSQAMADRYTYIPTIGLLVMIVWFVGELVGMWKLHYQAVALASIAVIAVLISLTEFQLIYWHDTLSLFQHSLDVTADNFLGELYLGVEYASHAQLEAEHGNPDAWKFYAISDQHYQRSLAIRSDFPETHVNYGNSLMRRGQFGEAINHYIDAIRRRPGFMEAHYMLGVAYAQTGQFDLAIPALNVTLQIDPHSAQAHSALGNVYSQLGQIDRAIAEYRQALQLDSSLQVAKNGLANTLATQAHPQSTVPVKDH